MSELKKVIKVFEDGTQEEVENGIVIGCKGDDFNIQFMDVTPQDMCRSAIGLVEGLKKLGLGNLMDDMVSFYYNEKPEVNVHGEEGKQASDSPE